MQKILSLIGNLFMQPCDLDPLFLPVSGAFLHVRQLALFPFQLLLRLPVIFWILCFVSFAVFVQSVHREVESKESVWLSFRYLVFVLEQNACMILSARALAYCHRLEDIRGRNLSMLLHLDRSDLRQFQTAVGQEDVLIDAYGRIAVLSVSFGFESWKSCSRPFEEVLECLIQMAKRLLQRNAVDFLQEGVLFCFLQYSQLFGTESIAQGRLVFFVLADLSIEPMVVDKADTAECLCKEDLLCRSWIESEFAGFVWYIVSSSLSLIL